ncbi:MULTISPECIES: LamG-like jellyroll fold domain-containing protein [unclassified Nocardioides]|uniref:LamG-like jellyroll fold domain-containing protein n=1 Tax=unclassified Nocardioides TaxID=2615069 RepID=UPI00301489CB
MKLPTRRLAALAATGALLGAGLAATAPTPALAADDPAAPRDGLVAEYLLDETAGTVVHNTADGSASGTDARDATLRQGSDTLWGNGSLGFTGGAKTSGSWVELPDDLLAGKQQATISTELWADPTMLNGFHFLWNIGNDATSSYFFSSLNCGNGRRTLVGLKSAGTERLVQAGSCATQAQRWTNLTVTVDGATDTAAVYVDGTEVASGAMPYSPADIVDQTLNTIGRAPWPDPNFKGRVGAFRVYDRALAPAEVTALSDADAVEHATELQASAQALLAGIGDRTVNGDTTLPTGNGTITWTSADPAVVGTDGDVVQPPTGSEPVEVDLTATVTIRGLVATKTITVTVLPEADPEDPYGYLMVHFIEDSAGYAEKIYLDVSRDDDPTHWLPLNDGEPILASNLGTTGVRDPYLTYNPETETYYLIATDLRVFGGDNAGWGTWSRRGSQFLNVWESKDLVEWGPLRQLKVSPPTAGMSWAPEATWEPSLGKFVVYWASTLFDPADTAHTGSTYSRILYGTTSDFATDYEYQGVMIDTGADVIDTTVLQNGGTTYRLSKDNGSGRGIYYEKTTAADWWKPTTTWTQIQTNLGQADYGSVEGPAIFKDHSRDHWYAYVDVIPSIGYRPYETTDLDAGFTKVDVASTGFVMPPSTKHGGVVSLTKAQYDEVRASDVAELVTQEVDVTTDAGTAPELPATAEVVLEDGRTDDVPVAWDAVEPAAYATAGSFTVEGRVKAIANNLNQATGVGQPLTSTTAIDNVVTATVTVEPLPVPPAPVATVAPRVAGAAVVGRTLSATTGTWDVPGAVLTRQWLRDGVPVAGATGSSYTLRPGDAGRRFAVRVTATASSRPAGTATSARTAAVARAASATRLRASATRVRRGKQVRLTVTVTGVQPTGAVRITDNGRVLRTLTLRAGTATVRVPLKKRGRHRLVATYLGTAWALPSRSATTTVTVK